MMGEGCTLVFLTVCMCIFIVCANDSGIKYYTNTWLVHVPLGEIAAKEVARSNNMEYKGPDFDNEGFHCMVKNEIPRKTYSHSEEITKQLNNHDLVTVASQEAVKARAYRSVVQPRHAVPREAAVSESYDFVRPGERDFRGVETRGVTRSQDIEIVDDTSWQNIPIEEGESNYKYTFNDEHWRDMWYLQDFRTNSSTPVLDMNVVPVYFELKITGKNVNVTVPDDGLEYTHPEISSSFNPDISWNYVKNDADIRPNRDVFGDYRSHGTRCAGEIVMRPNNGLCGVGIAFGAKIGGIKFLDETSTDAREAKVLKYAIEYVSIYSNSWGPADTGTVMEHLSDLVKMSLSKGIHEGRDGKGAIYVFAAGNGKADGDNCACDGYVNSIYTIVIASCDDSGHVTHYSERCNAIMATAYSGSGLEKNVLTTDVNKKCTDGHTGTSAAAPLVSGVVALALSANSNLTYRDVQYLLVWTSQVAPLSDNFGWNRNKAGFYYSMDFGFGLVNAYQLVRLALKWINVPEMSSCGIRMPKVKGFPVTRNKAARITVYSNGCKGMSGEVQYMEYVQLVVTMTYPKRGDIQIAMKSPLGTECHVLESRPRDYNSDGLVRWTFSVLAFWGESPRGNFTIDIFDTTGDSSNKGEILEMTLSIHGTKDVPKIYENGPRPYDAFKLAKPGDPPRYANLYLSTLKSIQKTKVHKRPHVSNSNAPVRQHDDDAESKQQIIDSQAAASDVQNADGGGVQSAAMETTKHVDDGENAAVPATHKKPSHHVPGVHVTPAQNGGDDIKRRVKNSEMMNSNLRNAMMKIEQVADNLDRSILPYVGPLNPFANSFFNV